METDEIRALLKDNGAYNRFKLEEENGDDNLAEELQLEEEKLIADILLVELDHSDTIDIDPDDETVRKEIRAISHDIVDITEIW